MAEAPRGQGQRAIDGVDRNFIARLPALMDKLDATVAKLDSRGSIRADPREPPAVTLCQRRLPAGPTLAELRRLIRDLRNLSDRWRTSPPATFSAATRPRNSSQNDPSASHRPRRPAGHARRLQQPARPEGHTDDLRTGNRRLSRPGLAYGDLATRHRAPDVRAHPRWHPHRGQPGAGRAAVYKRAVGGARRGMLEKPCWRMLEDSGKIPASPPGQRHRRGGVPAVLDSATLRGPGTTRAALSPSAVIEVNAKCCARARPVGGRQAAQSGMCPAAGTEGRACCRGLRQALGRRDCRARFAGLEPWPPATEHPRQAHR